MFATCLQSMRAACGLLNLEDVKARIDVFADDRWDALRSIGLQPKRTSRESPWQNGVAEGWVGSCRRELVDHVILLNEQYLRRLIRDYVRYYDLDRTHDGLGKDTPDRRSTENRDNGAKVISLPRVGGLHHR